jgi:serine/threonine protein kinase
MELTGTHELLGTPAYMSPEQLGGAPVDARSDQFSFCVALFESLYGQRPFIADSLEGLRRALPMGALVPTDDRGVPERTWQALVRGLALKPEERFPTLDLLLSELRASTVTPKPRRRWVSWMAVTMGLLAVVGLAVAAWPTPARSPPPRSQERPAGLEATRLPVPVPVPVPVDLPRALSAPPPKGSLRLSVYPWGDIYLDGVLVKRGTRLLKTKLVPGHHLIRVVHPTFPAREVGVEISSGKTTDQEVLLGTAQG